MGIDACELISPAQEPTVINLLQSIRQDGQKALLGQCLPPRAVLEEFARNDEI